MKEEINERIMSMARMGYDMNRSQYKSICNVPIAKLQEHKFFMM